MRTSPKRSTSVLTPPTSSTQPQTSIKAHKAPSVSVASRTTRSSARRTTSPPVSSAGEVVGGSTPTAADQCGRSGDYFSIPFIDIQEGSSARNVVSVDMVNRRVIVDPSVDPCPLALGSSDAASQLGIAIHSARLAQELQDHVPASRLPHAAMQSMAASWHMVYELHRQSLFLQSTMADRDRELARVTEDLRIAREECQGWRATIDRHEVIITALRAKNARLESLQPAPLAPPAPSEIPYSTKQVYFEGGAVSILSRLRRARKVDPAITLADVLELEEESEEDA